MTCLGHVFVRADAGMSIGIGHIRRCGILADELSKRGGRVVLVTRTEPATVSAKLGWPYSVIPLDGELSRHADEELADAERTCSIIERYGVGGSWVIADCERLGHRWERFVREAGHRVMAFDDSRTRRHCADIVVSDSEMPFDDAFLEACSSTRKLCGRQYALLDERFRPISDKSGDNSERKITLLVTYGGSDPTGETAKAIRALSLLQQSLKLQREIGYVDIVVGPLNQHAEAISAEACGLKSVRLHHAPACLAPLMESAHIVLTAGGSSLMEALVMRKPCLVTVTANNQQSTVSELARNNAVRFLGHHSQVTAEQMAQEIAAVVEQYEEIVRRLTQRQFYDHSGAKRIAEAMILCLAEAQV